MKSKHAAPAFFALAMLLFVMAAFTAPDYALADGGGPNLTCITQTCAGCNLKCTINSAGTACLPPASCRNVNTCLTCSCSIYVNECCCY